MAFKLIQQWFFFSFYFTHSDNYRIRNWMKWSEWILAVTIDYFFFFTENVNVIILAEELTWFCLLFAQKNPNVATKSTITASVSPFSLDFGPQYFSRIVTTSKNCNESDSWLKIDWKKKWEKGEREREKRKKKGIIFNH